MSETSQWQLYESVSLKSKTVLTARQFYDYFSPVGTDCMSWSRMTAVTRLIAVLCTVNQLSRPSLYVAGARDLSVFWVINFKSGSPLYAEDVISDQKRLSMPVRLWSQGHGSASTSQANGQQGGSLVWDGQGSRMWEGGVWTLAGQTFFGILASAEQVWRTVPDIQGCLYLQRSRRGRILFTKPARSVITAQNGLDGSTFDPCTNPHI